MLWDPKKDRSNNSLALLAAADYIEKHGWCQGQLKDNKGRVCMMGAVLGPVNSQEAIRLVLEADNGKFLDGKFFSQWNDVPGRTKEEVVNKLREIAQHL